MGYLNKQSRVIDIVLTEHGRKLYAIGDLNFEYFALFDDGIDYDPWSTGSLTDNERELQIDATLSLEAPFIKDVMGTIAPLEPINHLFTASPGFELIPQMLLPNNDSISLAADQRNNNGIYQRTGTSLAQIDMDIIGDAEQGNPGFILRTFSSSSNGLQQLDIRNDLNGRKSFDPFIAISIDSQTVIDKKSISKPDDTRSAGNITTRKR